MHPVRIIARSSRMPLRYFSATLLITAGVVLAQEPPANTAPPSGDFVIASGTRIPLGLINSISTKNAAEGDRVYLETVFPGFWRKTSAFERKRSPECPAPPTYMQQARLRQGLWSEWPANDLGAAGRSGSASGEVSGGAGC